MTEEMRAEKAEGLKGKAEGLRARGLERDEEGDGKGGKRIGKRERGEAGTRTCLAMERNVWLFPVSYSCHLCGLAHPSSSSLYEHMWGVFLQEKVGGSRAKPPARHQRPGRD